MKKICLIAGLVFVPARIALANPVLVYVGTGFTPPELAALLGETLVVALILALCGFDFLRVLYTWFPVTLFTYWIFVAGSFLGVSALTGSLPPEDVQPPLLVSVIAVSEVLVILVETYVIIWLAARKFYRNGSAPFPKAHALGAAAAGNVVSVALGFVWFFAT